MSAKALATNYQLQVEGNCQMLGLVLSKEIHFAFRHRRAINIAIMTGRDSDLEAFSHNPSDGSFAPLAYRPSTWTKCLNLRFLSY